MAQIRLINNTGKTSIVGKLVKYDPANSKAFVYAKEGDPGVMGKVARKALNGNYCLITLISKIKEIFLPIKEVVVNAPPPANPVVGEIIIIEI